MKLDELYTTNNRSVYNKLYKIEQKRQGKLYCEYCPYHVFENAARQPKHMSWKKIRKDKAQWSKQKKARYKKKVWKRSSYPSEISYYYRRDDTIWY